MPTKLEGGEVNIGPKSALERNMFGEITRCPASAVSCKQCKF